MLRGYPLVMQRRFRLLQQANLALVRERVRTYPYPCPCPYPYPYPRPSP